MLNSLRTKITVPIIGVLSLFVVFIVVFVAVSVHNFAEDRAQERMLGASQAEYHSLQRLEAYSRMTARAVSRSQSLEVIVKNWNNDYERDYNRQALLEYLGSIRMN